MEEHIKLRLEYKELIHSGKSVEAYKVLEKIWSNEMNTKKPSKIVETKIVETEEVIEAEAKKNVSEIISLSDLNQINGIGKKTVKDIKLMFDNLDSLKVALRDDKVALRDDVVSLLRETLI